jgi:hypothetical protein
MRVEVEKSSPGLDADHDAGRELGLSEDGPDALGYALGGDSAQLPQQGAIIAKIHSDHLGNSQHDLAMRNGPENRGVEPLGKGGGTLGMTTGAHRSSLARKR